MPLVPLALCSCSLEMIKIGLGACFLEFLLRFQSTKSVSYCHGFCFPETQDNKLARKFPF